MKERVEKIIENNSRIISGMQPLKQSEPWMDNLELCFRENSELIKDLWENQRVAIGALEKIAATKTMSWQEKEKLPFNCDIAEQALSTIRGK